MLSSISFKTQWLDSNYRQVTFVIGFSVDTKIIGHFGYYGHNIQNGNITVVKPAGAITPYKLEAIISSYTSLRRSYRNIGRIPYILGLQWRIGELGATSTRGNHHYVPCISQLRWRFLVILIPYVTRERKGGMTTRPIYVCKLCIIHVKRSITSVIFFLLFTRALHLQQYTAAMNS